MADELNKPIFKPRFQSEFSMGEFDFKRFDDWLGKAEYSSASINSCEVPDLQRVQNYFAELNVLYKSWRSLISSKDIKTGLDDAIKDAKIKKRKWEQAIVSGVEFNKNAIFLLIDLLDEIHTRLLDIKQIIGLGIVVKKVMSTKEKIKQGIKPFKDYGQLPEA